MAPWEQPDSSRHDGGSAFGKKIVSIIGQLPGALVGGIIGAAAGPPGAIVGAVAGIALSAIGADIADRIMSPAQERRMGEVYLAAASAIVEKQTLHGAQIRSDGFFDGDRSTGEEFVEGVMIAAMGSYEERRIPYLGNLIANVALSDGLDATAAHTALRVSDTLSWNEMVVLGIVADSAEFPLPPSPLAIGGNWLTWSVSEAIRTLVDPPKSLLTYAPIVLETGIPSYDLNLSALDLTPAGTLIVGLMELTTIPRPDRQAVYEVIVGIRR